MDNRTFQELQRCYAPVVTNIIASNMKFYRFGKTINWQFFYDERVAIFGMYDNKKDVLSINIYSVAFSFERNEPLHIEYFLLHEIRHAFQFTEMSDYKAGRDICIDLEIIKKWIDEHENYVGVLIEDGSENPKYFNQDMEFDAYAFAYAVMKYKYGEISYLYKPTAYDEEFDKTVEDWCKAFKSEGL